VAASSAAGSRLPSGARKKSGWSARLFQPPPSRADRQCPSAIHAGDSASAASEAGAREAAAARAAASGGPEASGPPESPAHAQAPAARTASSARADRVEAIA